MQAEAAAAPARELSRPGWRWEWALLLLLLGAAFFPVLRWMYERWMAADSYTSHGLLVPPICAWLVYQQRDALAREERRPARLGLLLLGAGLLIFAAGGLLRVYFTSGFALLLCLAGMLAYWGGWHWLRRLWFPLVFLVFMLPLPEIAVARLQLLLKLYVAKAAVLGVELAGIPVVLEGARLRLQNGDLVVGDVCAGLRSMAALIALGVLFAWLYGGRSKFVRGALLAAILPAALAANVLRIFLNVLFVNFYGTEPLFRPLFSSSFSGPVDLHLLSGVIVFIFAIAALYGTQRGAEALAPRAPETQGGQA